MKTVLKLLLLVVILLGATVPGLKKFDPGTYPSPELDVSGTVIKFTLDRTDKSDPNTVVNVTGEVSYDNGKTWEFICGVVSDATVIPPSKNKNGTTRPAPTVASTACQLRSSPAKVRGTMTVTGGSLDTRLDLEVKL